MGKMEYYTKRIKYTLIKEVKILKLSLPESKQLPITVFYQFRSLQAEQFNLTMTPVEIKMFV